MHLTTKHNMGQKTDCAKPVQKWLLQASHLQMRVKKNSTKDDNLCEGKTLQTKTERQIQ